MTTHSTASGYRRRSTSGAAATMASTTTLVLSGGRTTPIRAGAACPGCAMRTTRCASSLTLYRATATATSMTASVRLASKRRLRRVGRGSGPVGRRSHWPAARIRSPIDTLVTGPFSPPDPGRGIRPRTTPQG
jgi:hypothetical protein